MNTVYILATIAIAECFALMYQSRRLIKLEDAVFECAVLLEAAAETIAWLMGKEVSYDTNRNT